MTLHLRVNNVMAKRNCVGKITCTRFYALLVIGFGFKNNPPNDFCYVSTCKNQHSIQNMLAITFTMCLNWSFFLINVKYN